MYSSWFVFSWQNVTKPLYVFASLSAIMPYRVSVYLFVPSFHLRVSHIKNVFLRAACVCVCSRARLIMFMGNALLEALR